MLDWLAFGADYARMMVDTAQALATALAARQVPVFAGAAGATASHQFAIDARRWGGGQAASKYLRRGGVLACGIGLPLPEIAGDMNGLRLGTPEIVRRGMTPADMPALADLIADILASDAPETLAPRAAAMRARFTGVHFVRD
jgi:glycine hydroxymethyltransferase